VAVAAASNGACAPKYAYEYLQNVACAVAGGEFPSTMQWKISSIGSAIPVYTGSRADCQLYSAGSTVFYSLGSEVSPTMFAQGTIVTEQ
jgi:hypothetical protein